MRMFSISALVLAAFTLSACETVQGAGEDISNAGDALSAESRDVQSDL